jgi:P-type conjugative transfer protein TrbJ
MNRLHRLATAGVIAFAVFVCPEPASAQLVVFDPNNYAQNVLTAARALQQINNQIASLQNQAQMLINQAKNLATPRLNASPMISNRSTVRSPRLTRRHHQAFQTRR